MCILDMVAVDSCHAYHESTSARASARPMHSMLKVRASAMLCGSHAVKAWRRAVFSHGLSVCCGVEMWSCGVFDMWLSLRYIGEEVYPRGDKPRHDFVYLSAE